MHVRCHAHSASWQVTRRYSDFAKLHETLSSAKLAGPPLPPLPTKFVLPTDASLRQRAHELTRFSNLLLQSAPALGTDTVASFFEFERGLWHRTLTPCTPAEQEAALTRLQAAVRKRAAERAARRRMVAIKAVQQRARGWLSHRDAARLRAHQRGGCGATQVLGWLLVQPGRLVQRGWGGFAKGVGLVPGHGSSPDGFNPCFAHRKRM